MIPGLLWARPYVQGCLLAAVGIALSLGSVHARTDNSPQSLFNGTDLTGWQAVGAAIWRVEDDMIVGGGPDQEGDGFLLHPGVVTDFELSVQFSIDSQTNSGVFIRCQDMQRIHPETCFELNIWDEHPNQAARTGAIVFRAMPPLATVHTLDGWNTLRVIARGDQIRVYVNGERTAELTDASLPAGFIALQRWGGGEVRFRSIGISR